MRVTYERQLLLRLPRGERKRAILFVSPASHPLRLGSRRLRSAIVYLACLSKSQSPLSAGHVSASGSHKGCLLDSLSSENCCVALLPNDQSWVQINSRSGCWILSMPNLGSANGGIPEAEDLETCRAWDKLLICHVAGCRPNSSVRGWTAPHLEKLQFFTLYSRFASRHLHKMVLNISLPDNYGHVALTAMSTGWLLVVRRLPFQNLTSVALLTWYFTAN